MRIDVDGFSTSIGDLDEEEMAFIYCADKHSGYCLSLSRFLHNDSDLIDVMVYDQVWCSTQEITVILSRDELKVELSPSVAQQLMRVTEYTVTLTINDNQFNELDAALTVIFEGINQSRYDRAFNAEPRIG
jgi:hypothetical protein